MNLALQQQIKRLCNTNATIERRAKARRSATAERVNTTIVLGTGSPAPVHRQGTDAMHLLREHDAAQRQQQLGALHQDVHELLEVRRRAPPNVGAAPVCHGHEAVRRKQRYI